jgi:hypothetical protein
LVNGQKGTIGLSRYRKWLHFESRRY